MPDVQPTNNPVPSDHPADARDNFKIIDEVVNLQSPQSSPTRTGRILKTLFGLESEFITAIRNAGGIPINGGVWASGQTFNSYNEFMIFNGVAYRPLSTTDLPYGPTGSAPDLSFVGPYESFNAGDLGDYTTIQYENDSSLAAGDPIFAMAGEYVRVSSRGDSLWKIQAGGDPNNFDVINAGQGNTAVLQKVNNSENLGLIDVSVRSLSRKISLPSSFPVGVVDISYGANGSFIGNINIDNFDVIDSAANTTHYYIDTVNGSDGNDGLTNIEPGVFTVATSLEFDATNNQITDYGGELLNIVQAGSVIRITSPLTPEREYSITSISGRVLNVDSVINDENITQAKIRIATGSGRLRSLTGLSSIFSLNNPNTPIHIHFMDEVITRSFSLGGLSFTYNVDLKMSANRRATLSHFRDFSELSWAQDGNAWHASAASTYDVFDMKNRESSGSPMQLVNVGSISEVQSTPGSWFDDSGVVYVRFVDDRNPATSRDYGVAVGTSDITQTVLNNRTLFIENLDIIWGAQYSYNSDQGARLICVNSWFSGCRTSNGLSSNSFEYSIMYKCGSSYNFADGFNYHNFTSGVKTAIEVDCTSHSQGIRSGSGSNNASTAHDGMNVIRVNTVGYGTDGPVIVDVNGCQSFNVGCNAGESLRPDGNTRSSFYFDDSGAVTPGETWLLGCSGGGGDTLGISSDLVNNIHVEDWRGNLLFRQGISFSEF